MNCYDYKEALQNRQKMVCSPDGDTAFYDIITGVLQGGTSSLHLFLIFQDGVFS